MRLLKNIWCVLYSKWIDVQISISFFCRNIKHNLQVFFYELLFQPYKQKLQQPNHINKMAPVKRVAAAKPKVAKKATKKVAKKATKKVAKKGGAKKAAKKTTTKKTAKK